jgi:uncharacterized membrane protein
MLSFSHPLALLLFIPALGLTVLTWRDWRTGLSDGRRLAGLGIRICLIAAIVLSLAGVAAHIPESKQATVFIADLSASDAGQRSQMQAFINDSTLSKPAGDMAGVVSAAGSAAIEQPVSSATGFDGFEARLPDSATDLQSGLDLAGGMLPTNAARRVVLLSDGRQNQGNAILSAQLLRARGIRVDIVPVAVRGGADVSVDSVSVPGQMRTDERFTLSARIRSNVFTRTGITVYRGNGLEVSKTVSVHPGMQTFTFPQSPVGPGFHGFHVRISPQLDRQPNNDSGSAYTVVGGPPRVLVIARRPQEAADVVRALRTTGIRADLRRPTQIAPTLPSLQRYSSIVLVDTAAENLDPLLQQDLVPYVRDMGRGLVVIGGQQSYGLGGYGGTPIERVLPVRMQLPSRPDVPTVGVVLIVESLEASMPINVSKAAAKGVIQLLTEQDRVAVDDAPDAGGPGWVVHLRPVLARSPIDRAIDGMQPGDPTSYVPYLRSAYRALAGSPTRLKHIILLGDGDAHDPQYRSVARFIRRHGVTISTVATNAQQPADYQTMRQLAHWGGGRYYLADNVEKVPHIFLQEARTVARSGIIRGSFTPKSVSNSPLTRSLQPMPPLTGYVAVTPKPRAQMVLVSKEADPLLATWQYGLGRTVAWTSDAAGLWSRRLVQSPRANRFWADLVSWTLPATARDTLFVNTATHGSQTEISVAVPTDVGSDPRVVAHVAGPGVHADLTMQPTAPQRYAASFSTTAQGSYFVTVRAVGRRAAASGEGGLVLSYPAEYRSVGTDARFLRALASAGGGSLIRSPSQVWKDSLAPVYADQSLGIALLILAALLLPLDIALRRFTVTRRDLQALREAVTRVRKARAA